MEKRLAIHWFRQDLRIVDNPALYDAAEFDVLPIYILDTQHAGAHFMGAASRVWLHHSLQHLQADLDNNLRFFKGDPIRILPELCRQLNVTHVFWNRCYEPWRMQRDQRIKEQLTDMGVSVSSHNSALLWEPWRVQKQDGTPFKVFTPFYRKGCLSLPAPRQPLPAPNHLQYTSKDCTQAVSLEQLDLLSQQPWVKNIITTWSVGEQAAYARMTSFLEDGIQCYKEGRNFPAKPFVSRLSPYLHFGEISPHQIWHATQALPADTNTDHFCSELGWREFSYSQLYHNHSLPTDNLQNKFDAFPWIVNADHVRAWQSGQTGIPIVDAGMRELWQTGYMHNRVRMIVGSFLVKNLLIDWRVGERWFWDCLFDADLASNSASWQWVAGCGADAAPYFRIFNPIMQGQKFDPDGVYVRKYVPELAAMPTRFLFNPWEAPVLVLREAGVELGKHYPKPIVDLKVSRARALEAFTALKQVPDA